MKKVNQKTLVILDAHAIIHRAYHALPDFTNSEGVPTGALYGLVSMLVRIIETLKPDAIVAAYDLPKPTFRHHAYAEYKGKRAKTDDNLVTQLQSSRGLFSAFNVPIVDCPSFEADDVIGTIVEQYKDDPVWNIIIASGDMDTLQLVEGKKVQVFTLKKGINDTVIYDEAAVLERYSFKPKQLVDYKGLRGDPSDNIIGVPGIGEKTATTIIEKFASIEGLYKAIEKGTDTGLSERIVNILKEHKDDAFFSKTLATIRRDAPIKYSAPEDTYLDSINEEAVTAILMKYEFRSLLPRVKKIFSFVDTKVEEIDQELLKLSSIALWVLYSEMTNPTYEDILNRTKKNTLKEAHDVIIEELKKKKLFEIFDSIERPIIEIVNNIGKHGILIDKKYFEMLKDRMKKRLLEIEKSIESKTKVEINLNSPKQLSFLLFDTLGLKPRGKKKESGAYTTNAETLESLLDDHPIIPMILEYREIQKLLTTYVGALLEHASVDGRVHSTFLQAGSTTGRFSSTNPNLQNIPIKSDQGKEIRHGFVATKGNIFIGSDYSQIELRILAILANDEVLEKTFEEGIDIHTRVAASMFGVDLTEVTSDMRRKAKVINFGILYGMGVTALQKNLGTNREEAAKFYEKYFETFPKIRDYLENTKKFASTHGYTETLFGRRRYFPAINSSVPFLRAMAERTATNAPIQGSNADIVKIAIALIDQDLKEEKLENDVHLVLQIHDELVYEVKEGLEEKVKNIIKNGMLTAFVRSPIKIIPPKVPLEVSVGIGHRLNELK